MPSEIQRFALEVKRKVLDIFSRHVFHERVQKFTSDFAFEMLSIISVISDRIVDFILPAHPCKKVANV